jgi:predicted ABC-type ATPase
LLARRVLVQSTNAREFLLPDLTIIDQDLAGYQYKKRGFVDHQDTASLRINQTVREHLFAAQNFALELNLGFQSHYDYLKSIAYFDRNNAIHLLLFFTDDITLCIDRAKSRHLSGGHEVKQAIVEEMYANTFPLFEQPKHLFATVRLIDVTDQTLLEPAADAPLPNWIQANHLAMYLLD